MNRIEEILERYWQCETSIEEERELRRYFSEGDIPQDIISYRALFAWREQASSQTMDKDVIPAGKKGIKIGFYPLMKVAAIALILLTIGIGFYTHYHQSQKVDRILSETYTDPQEAIKETDEVVAKISSLLREIEEHKNQPDSIVIDKGIE